MGAQSEPRPGELLDGARAALEAGDPGSALDLLRELRSGFPSDPLVADALGLSIDASLASGDFPVARYFLDRLAELYPGSPAGFQPAMTLGDRSWQAGDWATALAAYRVAADAAVNPAPADRDRGLVRAADIELNREHDEQSAREHWVAARPANLEPADLERYRRLRIRLAWKAISPAMLGLPDANISALVVDGDDLWVGTWNGGSARWSFSSATAAAFPAPESPRDFQPLDRRVWAATFSGLAFYARGSGNWTTTAALAGSKVQALAVAGGELYAGTLGEGLLRLRGDRWERVGDDDWPGRFINCLATDGSGRLLVGTMNLGLMVLDPATDEIVGLAELAPEFTPLNITSVLADSSGRIWIGTYGDGLWLWEAGSAQSPGQGSASGADGKADEVRRFDKETGEIADDWVLAICESDTGVWFGTFGGGASFLSSDGEWRKLGVLDGLPSLDVSAIAWRRPWVYFGTLGAGVAAYWEAAGAR